MYQQREKHPSCELVMVVWEDEEDGQDRAYCLRVTTEWGPPAYLLTACMPLQDLQEEELEECC